MTQYPGAIDGYAQIRLARDGIDEIIAGDHNDLRSAVIALEQTLGVNPHGAYGTVVARLNDYGSRINVNETNFDEHVNGVAFRHEDTHIDAAAKAAVFNNLGVGTTESQVQELLELFDYPGSGSTFADGVGLGVQNFRTTPDDIVAQLGSSNGYVKVGAGLLPGVPLSLPAGSVRDHVSTLLNGQNAASVSDVFSPTGGFGGGTFGDLDLRIEANDGHSRTIISCTDGVLTHGGMYDGVDALERALNDVGGGGGTILVRGGEYHITIPLVLTRPTKIIGVEERPTIVNEVPGFMLTFDHDAYGSRVQNVEVINFGAGTYQAFDSIADDFLVKQCEIEGTIYLQAGRRPRIEQTRITPVDVDCITTGPGCILAEISQCELAPVVIDPITTSVTLLNHNGFGCNVSNTFFADGYGSQAITDTAITTGLKIRDCAVVCQPYKVNTPVIQLAGQRTEINGLYMYITAFGPSIISTPFIFAETDVLRICDLHLNMGESLIENSVESPVSISAADCIIDRALIYGGTIPMDVRDGFTMSLVNPIIQLTARQSVDLKIDRGRIKMTNSRIIPPIDGFAPAGNMNIIIIGDKGKGALEPLTPFGILELDNVQIDGSGTINWNAGDNKFMVANVQSGSKIHGCKFSGGNWDTPIAIIDSPRTQVLDNSFEFEGLIQIGSAVATGVSLFPTIDGVQINDNNILINDFNPGAYSFGAISLVAGNGCTMNNNVIKDVSALGAAPLVNMGACDFCTIVSNVLDAGAGGIGPFPPIVDAAPGPIGNLYTHGLLGPFDLNRWT